MLNKRLLSLLVLAVALTMAGEAMASHCQRCSLAQQDCIPVNSYGYEICVFEIDGCYLETRCPGTHGAIPEPLAADFIVASVERLDEPQTAAPETLVAVAATPAPATR